MGIQKESSTPGGTWGLWTVGNQLDTYTASLTAAYSNQNRYVFQKFVIWSDVPSAVPEQEATTAPWTYVDADGDFHGNKYIRVSAFFIDTGGGGGGGDDPDVVTVTFDPNLAGATVDPTSQDYPKDSSTTYGSLPTPTKQGHQFDGWFTASTGGTKVTGSSTLVYLSNHTLYAHWKKHTYKFAQLLGIPALATNTGAPSGFNYICRADANVPTDQMMAIDGTPRANEYTQEVLLGDAIQLYHGVGAADNPVGYVSYGNYWLWNFYMYQYGSIRLRDRIEYSNGSNALGTFRFAKAPLLNTISDWATDANPSTWTVAGGDTSPGGYDCDIVYAWYPKQFSVTVESNESRNGRSLGVATATVTLPLVGDKGLALPRNAQSGTPSGSGTVQMEPETVDPFGFNYGRTATLSLVAYSSVIDLVATPGWRDWMSHAYDVSADDVRFVRWESSAAVYWATTGETSTTCTSATARAYLQREMDQGITFTAIFERKTKLIFKTYYKNQVITQEISLAAGSTAAIGTLPAAPTYVNTTMNKERTFLGWFTEEFGGTEVTSSYQVTGGQTYTFHAHWQRIILAVVRSPTCGWLLLTGVATQSGRLAISPVDTQSPAETSSAPANTVTCEGGLYGSGRIDGLRVTASNETGAAASATVTDYTVGQLTNGVSFQPSHDDLRLFLRSYSLKLLRDPTTNLLLRDPTSGNLMADA